MFHLKHFGMQVCVLLILLSVTACRTTSVVTPLPLSVSAQSLQQQMFATFNESTLLVDLKALSSAAMQGRKPLTQGSELAQQYIIERWKLQAIAPLFTSYKQPIVRHGKVIGYNLAGFIPASVSTQKTIVISAHYDHLGKDYRGIFYGADDNASGVAAMLQFSQVVSPLHIPLNIIVLATDAEELGLYGSKFFVEQLASLDKLDVVLNINLDMLARGGHKRKLYFAATRQHPKLQSVFQQLLSETDLTLLQGHNQRDLSFINKADRVDWLNASDHAPFRQAGIPYIYLGVDPHADYHTQQDCYERIQPNFYISVTKLVLTTLAIVLAEF